MLASYSRAGDPVGHDLRTRVPIHRVERLVDRGERARAARTAPGGGQLAERAIEIGVGEGHARAGRDRRDVPQQRRKRLQPRAQLRPVHGRGALRALARRERLGAVQSGARVARRGNRPQQPDRRLAGPLLVAPRDLPRTAGAAAGRRRGRPGDPLVDPLPHQDPDNLVDAEVAETQTGTARAHRIQQHVGPCRHQHELRARRRLLQALQQRVLGPQAEQIGVVDDDHPPAPLERTIAHLLDRHPHLVDGDRPAVAGPQGQHVGVGAARDAPAGGAASATVDGQIGLVAPGSAAVERLGDGHRHQPLADPAGAGQQHAGRQRIPHEGARDARDDAPMADDFAERHGLPAS